MRPQPEDVLRFWFPEGLDRDEQTHRDAIARWFRGGTTDEIRARFVPTLEAAIRGELDDWARTPRGRLALILVLDQFSRSVYDDARAYAQDAKAQQLAKEAFDAHENEGLPVWEQMFLSLPFGHSEDLALQDRAVAISESLVPLAPPHLRALYEKAVNQPKAHRDVIRRFGRHPHRNAALGRTSTPEELAYIAAGDFPHTRKT
ncbi:MAG TPA: DUF924 family protein [Kofleriaceae bacterium]|nr:DUF924 family protein [Kofleriaceae bacterium]